MGRLVIGMACIVFAAGMLYTTWVFTHYLLDAHPWQFIPGLLVTGIGLSLVMIPIFTAALQDVDVNHAGSASGILNAVQQVGAAIGIAVIGVIFFGQLTNHSFQSFDKVSSNLSSQLSTIDISPELKTEVLAQTRTCFHDRTVQKDSNVLPASCQQLAAGNPEDPTSQAVGQAIADSAKQANAENFASAFRAGVVYFLLLLVVISALSLTLPKKFKMTDHQGM
jgi:hypothetical protein